MRGLAALAVVVATSACDLVFPPAQLEGDDAAVVDADPTTPDGPDEPDAPPGTPDAPPGTPDAVDDPDAMVSEPDAASCVLECLGESGGNGVTGCGPIAVLWCNDPSLDTLSPYDLCNCTNGTPSLIVFDVTPGNMRLAFLPQFGDTWYVTVDGGPCIPPTNDCELDNVCAAQPPQLVFYDFIQPSGGSMQFQFWFDEACVSGGTTFVYSP